MPHLLLARRWSTPVLFGISVGLSLIAFLGGRATALRHRDRPDDRPRPESIVPESKIVGAPEIPATLPVHADDRWQRSSVLRRTPASEREMAVCLEELAARDPQRAMALALGVGNYRLSQDLRGAVLRGWAAVSPDDAATWALARPAGERAAAMESVFFGAAQQPELAVRLVSRLCATEPVLAGDYGQFLITGLTEAGAYETAVRFAADDKSGHLDTWLNTAFAQWASHQPEQALSAFGKISDPRSRAAAFQGMILGWAMANPAAVAAYAERLTPGADRTEAMNQSLPQWASHDPISASEWMLKHFEPNPDRDAGVAAVAAMPNLITQRPEIAIGWAESITEPVLRANTLRVIAQQWAQQDPKASRLFFESNPSLLANDRAAPGNAPSPPPQRR